MTKPSTPMQHPTVTPGYASWPKYGSRGQGSTGRTPLPNLTNPLSVLESHHFIRDTGGIVTHAVYCVSDAYIGAQKYSRLCTLPKGLKTFFFSLFMPPKAMPKDMLLSNELKLSWSYPAATSARRARLTQRPCCIHYLPPSIAWCRCLEASGPAYSLHRP